MCLQPATQTDIPAQTVAVAKAAFPKGNMYISLRDEFATIVQDEQFQALYPLRGQPAEAPWRLALVSLMQFMESLTDLRRRSLCAGGSIGSMCWGWSWRIRGFGLLGVV